ncbi:MAG: peptide-N-glycosidase F-related protein [Ferruginibacter sp.]
MKKMFLMIMLAAFVQSINAQTIIHVFDNLTFFDGYAATVATPVPPTGVIRHRNDLYARKLTSDELASIGDTLHMKVTVKADCDNYDRIGNVNIALVTPGSTTYNPDAVQRIEIGRYITPFMNKNYSPTSVPYDYTIDNVAYLLKDTSITNHYDIWIELELFGVPYAANTQVAGCAGRNDVFYGSLDFTTNSASPIENNNVLMPLAFKQNFNNYEATATDTLGKTTRSISFTLEQDLTDAAFFLITSNHGANSGGEEYNRRNHYVYFDDALELTYKPGRNTCEPFRVYNTQGNGIYGSSTMSNAQWQSFSNWCPGDVIDIRKISLGAVSAGTHKFTIRVPQAVFAGGQGNIPLSVYLHGKTSGTLTAPVTPPFTPPVTPPVDTLSTGALNIYPVPAGSYLTVAPNSEPVQALSLIDILGHIVYLNDKISGKTIINTSLLSRGVYILKISLPTQTITRKILVVGTN